MPVFRRCLASNPLPVLAACIVGLWVVSSPAQGAPGDTEVVSRAGGPNSIVGAGSCGSGGKAHACLSGDGRYVVFESESSNLVFGDTNGVSDVFVLDRLLQQTSRVSVGANGAQGNGASGQPAISADGRFVTFGSAASNLVTGDTNATYDLFVHDLATRVTERVNLRSDGTQATGWLVGASPSISGDGRFVVFYSYAAMVPGDVNDDYDVYLRDRQAGTTRRVSVAHDGTEPNDSSYEPTVSADGRYVAFTSTASNLLPDGVSGRSDVFVRDLQTGSMERASESSDGTAGGGFASAISADGRYVAFLTSASLDATDTNGKLHVYVRDRALDLTERVTVSSTGRQANQHSFDPAISDDGRYVAFESDASNLVPGDTNRSRDIFVRDRSTGGVERASLASSGAEADGPSYAPSLSADGRLVTFVSLASNLDWRVARAMYLHELGGPKVKAYRLDPAPVLEFGDQTITTYRILTPVVTNTGTIPIWIASASLGGTSATQFQLSHSCRGWLQPTASCPISVTFRPTSVGNKQALLEVTAAEAVKSISLTGTGVRAVFELTPATVSFGDVPIGSIGGPKIVVVRNLGTSVLPLKTFYLSGTHASQFRRNPDCLSPIAIGRSCKVRVRFVPTSTGVKTATLTVTAGGGGGSRTVGLSGTGTSQ
ncbi:MAG TPA: choice-of-anchor D domain-containing protein [Steroidobacteraceae bacterium]|nr:choice-of-anchor D domain-containing protein [Steroidobacteraceae bacterium]